MFFTPKHPPLSVDERTVATPNITITLPPNISRREVEIWKATWAEMHAKTSG